MGTKMAVAFANIFMAKIEKEILRQSTTKPIFWKRFIDDVISMWNTSRDKIEDFVVKANSFHPTIKFTAEISETETTFFDTKVYKGDRFNEESILDVRTLFKATKTFQYTNFYSCQSLSNDRGSWVWAWVKVVGVGNWWVTRIEIRVLKGFARRNVCDSAT